MIQNLIFVILFLKILFHANFLLFVHKFQWTWSKFFFDFRFSQCQQKLEKMMTRFTIHFCSKNITNFTNLNSLDIEHKMFRQHNQKSFWLYKLQTFCSLVSKKTFARHRFWTLNYCILEALWKQMSVYVSVYLRKKIFVPEI